MLHRLTTDEARARVLRLRASFSEVVYRDVAGTTPDGVSLAFGTDDLAHGVRNPDGDGWTLEAAGERYAELAAAAATWLTADADLTVTLWVHTDDQPGEEFVLERSLRKMSRGLPIEASSAFPEDVEVRGFQPSDAEQWLTVNNRAFDGHPEQGGWSHADLEARMGFDWFEPDDLRLVFVDGRLAGFNWTKVEEGPRGRDGQIFVIGVDPDFHGRGLGRATVEEGLRHVHEARGATTTSLYVDEANHAGIHLYDSLGYETVELHRAYRYRPTSLR